MEGDSLVKVEGREPLVKVEGDTPGIYSLYPLGCHLLSSVGVYN